MISLFDIKRILTPEKSTMPSDDFRIIQSWAEYDETSGKNPENKNLNYLCYELEVMNPDTGERIYNKRICFFDQKDYPFAPFLLFACITYVFWKRGCL